MPKSVNYVDLFQVKGEDFLLKYDKMYKKTKQITIQTYVDLCQNCQKYAKICPNKPEYTNILKNLFTKSIDLKCNTLIFDEI